MYRKTMDGNLFLMAVYVDDLFVTGTNMRDINDLKKEMATKF